MKDMKFEEAMTRLESELKKLESGNMTLDESIATFEEAVKLIETVRDDKESKTRVRDHAIIVLFLNTGMRLSELVGLNLESFDPEAYTDENIGY